MKSGFSDVNVKNQKQWLGEGQSPVPVAKPGFNPQKVMCVWWDVRCIIYWELLPSNQMINSQLNCQQLTKV